MRSKICRSPSLTLGEDVRKRTNKKTFTQTKMTCFTWWGTKGVRDQFTIVNVSWVISLCHFFPTNVYIQDGKKITVITQLTNNRFQRSRPPISSPRRIRSSWCLPTLVLFLGVDSFFFRGFLKKRQLSQPVFEDLFEPNI